MPDVTGEEFQVFISLLSKLKTLELEHDQLVDLISEQAELENELQVSIANVILKWVNYFMNSWVSRDVTNFTRGQLQIDTQSLKGKKFSLYVLIFCLAANICNFVRLVHSSTI